jgi:hypothetical protein
MSTEVTTTTAASAGSEPTERLDPAQALVTGQAYDKAPVTQR